MYALTFANADSHPLVCAAHSDPDVLDTFLDLADVDDTDEVGDCLVCWDALFLDHYERATCLLNDDSLLALYHIACDWHGGQFSRGYRLLCHARRLLERRGLRLDDTPEPGYLAEWGSRLTELSGF